MSLQFRALCQTKDQGLGRHHRPHPVQARVVPKLRNLSLSEPGFLPMPLTSVSSSFPSGLFWVPLSTLPLPNPSSNYPPWLETDPGASSRLMSPVSPLPAAYQEKHCCVHRPAWRRHGGTCQE